MKYISVVITKEAAPGQGYRYIYPVGFEPLKTSNHTYSITDTKGDISQPETLYCEADDTITIVAGITEMTQVDWQAAVDLIKGA